MSGSQLMTENPNESMNTAKCLGRQQAYALVANQCTAAQAQCLKEIHDTRAYQTYGLTWEQFCDQHAGISRAHRGDCAAGHNPGDGRAREESFCFVVTFHVFLLFLL